MSISLPGSKARVAPAAFICHYLTLSTSASPRHIAEVTKNTPWGIQEIVETDAWSGVSAHSMRPSWFQLTLRGHFRHDASLRRC